ncbi:MAG: ABC transporter permease [Bacteroidales bacterium]
MSKLFLVIKREYVSRVKNKTFLLLTLLMPLLFAAMIAVPLWLSTIKSSNEYKVGLVDNTSLYGAEISDMERYKFERLNSSIDSIRGKDSEGSYYAFLIIEPPVDESQLPRITLYSNKQIDPELRRHIERELNRFERDRRLSMSGISNIQEIISNADVRFQVNTIKWGDKGVEQESSGEIAMAIGMFITILIYMFIFIYGAQVMNSVMEEKSNRIIEILVSSVKPFDLMMGKILAVALVGLTQILLWVVIGTGLMFYAGVFLGIDAIGDMSQMQGASPMMVPANEMPEIASLIMQLQSFNWPQIITLFLIFFIGGYLVYSSIFAAIGAAVDNPNDSQQFMMPVTVLILFAFYAGIYSVQNPDGPLAFWGSLFPLTSPIVMMVRLPFGVPFWQIALSITLLFACFFGVVYLSAKIYRIGILMYGKKPSWKELWKWIKYS